MLLFYPELRALVNISTENLLTMSVRHAPHMPISYHLETIRIAEELLSTYLFKGHLHNDP